MIVGTHSVVANLSRTCGCAYDEVKAGHAYSDHFKPAAVACLLALALTGQVTSSELAQVIGMAQGTVTGHLRRLIDKGWVRRIEHGRVIRYTLSVNR